MRGRYVFADFLGGFDPFHLWHGDVHQYMSGGRGVSVMAARRRELPGDFTANVSIILAQILAGKDGIVHYK